MKIIFVIIAVLGLTACDQKQQNIEKSIEPIKQTLPTIVGDLTIGAPLPKDWLKVSGAELKKRDYEMWRSILPTSQILGVSATVFRGDSGPVVEIFFDVGAPFPTVVSDLSSKYGAPKRKVIPGDSMCPPLLVALWRDKQTVLYVDAWADSEGKHTNDRSFVFIGVESEIRKSISSAEGECSGMEREIFSP